MTATLSAKGQLVIPADIRKRHHLGPGSKVTVFDNGQEIVLIPIPKDAFRASRGMLKGYSVKEFLRWRRQEKRREDAEFR